MTAGPMLLVPERSAQVDKEGRRALEEIEVEGFSIEESRVHAARVGIPESHREARRHPPGRDGIEPDLLRHPSG